jgi:hypothetical protein
VIAALALLPLLTAVDDGETVVRARSAGDVDETRVESGSLWDGGAALLLVPGAAVARDGGPLAPVRPLVRGLSGPRLDVDALGLPLNDPAAGVVDVLLLPWGLGDVVVDVGAGRGIAGGLSLRRPAPGLDVVVGAGDLSTLRGRARLSQHVIDGHVVAFADVGTTRGDFRFQNDDALGTGGPTAVRQNNDQQRVNAALAAHVNTSGVGVDVAAAAGLRRGGVPGFASAPLALRAEDALGALGARIATRSGPARVAFVIDATASDRRVIDENDDSRLVGARVGIAAEAGARVVDGIDVDGTLRADRSGVVSVVDRAALHAALGARARRSFAALALTVDALVAVDVVDDHDVEGSTKPSPSTATLPSGSLRLSLGAPDAALLGFVGIARAVRAPTLDERFAPRGFLRGNPGLRPESIDEVEAGVVVAAPGARARVIGHASALHDVIVVVHKNAFEVTAENTGQAARAGVDLGVDVMPLPLVSMGLSAGLLWSALSSTGAPVPGAPPLVFACAPRLGDERAWVRAVVAARGPASSTLFGTLSSPGSVLVDVDGHVPLGERLGVMLTVQNVLDVRNARDQNLLPLPGRLVFLSLEVHV